MLVELKLVNLYAMIKHIKQNSSIYGFLTLEPLSSKETVFTYMKSAAVQVKDQLAAHKQQVYKLATGIDPAIHHELRSSEIIRKGYG